MSDKKIRDDFMDELSRLSSTKRSLKELSPKPFEANTARKAHLTCVMADPDFADDFEAALKSNKKRNKYGALFDKYAITAIELATITKGPYILGSPASFTNPNYNIEEEVVDLKIQPTLTREEFDYLWDILQEIVQQFDLKKGLKRPPEKPDLIYAIFRARKSTPQKTFPKIYELYMTRKLPKYSKKPSGYQSHEDLKRYYLRHRPDK